MKESLSDSFSRRKVLASTAVAVGSGLFSTSAVASRNPDEDGRVSELNDKVTIENGMAAVSEEVGRTVHTATANNNGGTGEQAATYTAQDFAEDINEGVRAGIWRATERGGEIRLILTSKGRRFFEEIQSTVDPSASTNGGRFSIASSHCDGETKLTDDALYLNDNDTEQIQTTLIGSGAVLAVGAALVSIVGGLTTGPAGVITGRALALAGTLSAAGAGYISTKNEGCGIKVVGSSVKTQECNC